MAFEKAGVQIPTTVPTIELHLSRTDTANGTAAYAARYELVLIDQNGNRINFPAQEGDVIPHLTTTERNQLVSIMDRLHQVAKTSLLT